AEEFAANQKTDRAVAQWARESLPPQATVITFGITETLKHFTSFQVVELYNETSASLLARAESAEKFFVLVNVENLREQWQDRAPQINFDALSRARSLRRVAAFGAYTLFAVE
ncbi:MAG: hypothetical protein HY070_05165, partial [Chloroflexi bacterium]|nr:hypothetical protein [Chloroflexota bacterium]